MLKQLQRRRVALVGPSGVGKSALIELLIQIMWEVRLAVSCTTRDLRLGEIEGVHYRKLAPEEFQQKIKENFFAETDPHHGGSYGTPWSETSLEKGTVFFDVDVHGARRLKEIFSDLVMIFIHPPNADALKERLENRVRRGKGTWEEIPDRLARYDYEKGFADDFDYQLVNDDLHTCLAELAMIIFKEQGGTVIAIDGTSGCGKTTLACKLAEDLGGGYVDSGLFYRLVAYTLGIQRGITPDVENLKEYLDNLVAEFEQLLVDELILRSPDVDAIVASWACVKEVRTAVFLLELKAVYGAGKAIMVPQGRDMTTHLCPGTKFKFFVDCPVEIRAARRSKENGKSIEENIRALQARDHADMTRPIQSLFHDKENGVILILNEPPLSEVLNQMRGYLK